MPDPLPCPFCGKDAEFSTDPPGRRTGKYARCPSMFCADRRWTALRIWNRRAVDPRLATLVRAADAWHLEVEFPTLSREVLALSSAIDALPPDLLEACGVSRG